MTHSEPPRFESEHFDLEWDPQRRILFITLRGLLDEQVARAYRREMTEFLQLHGISDEHHQIAQISGIVKVTRAARQVFVEHTRVQKFQRAAVYGLNAMLKVLLSFVVFAAGRKADVKSCSSREEAIEWVMGAGEQEP